MITKKYIIFILPHPDDEIFILPKIIIEKKQNNVLCIFLTFSKNFEIRNKESLKTLNKIGLNTNDVIFFSNDQGAEDGYLIYKIQKVKESLLNLLKDKEIDKIFAPNWEGGHQDHDAACLISHHVSSKLNIYSRLFFYPTYQGETTRGIFFNVMKPLKINTYEETYYPIKLILIQLMCIKNYRSQWKSWIGLAPFIIFYYLLKRKGIIIYPNPTLLLLRPHKGKLLYERWKRMTYEKFIYLKDI